MENKSYHLRYLLFFEQDLINTYNVTVQNHEQLHLSP